MDLELNLELLKKNQKSNIINNNKYKMKSFYQLNKKYELYLFIDKLNYFIYYWNLIYKYFYLIIYQLHDISYFIL